MIWSMIGSCMDVIDSAELLPSDAGTATREELVLQAEWH